MLVTMKGRRVPFEGPLPHGVGSLRAIQRLWLEFALLAGALPEAVSGMTSLKDLHFLGTKLCSVLPDAIQSWGTLKVVSSLKR